MENKMQAFFAMTELEQLLKQILQQRPDIRSRILTGQELTDYISWMAKNSTVSSFYRAFVSYYGKPPKQYLEETI